MCNDKNISKIKDKLITKSVELFINSIDALISVIKKNNFTDVKYILYKTRKLCQQSVSSLKA